MQRAFVFSDLSTKAAAATQTLAQGLEALHKGDYRAALEIANRLLEANANDVGATALRGYAQFGLGSTAKALADFDAAVVLEPNLPDLHLARCEILYESHRLDEAIAAWNDVS